MKAPAFILLFPFTVFLAETVRFPQEVKSSCSEIPCAKMKEMMPVKCNSQKHNSQKPSGKCNDKTDCSICPVCLMFTFLPQYEWSVNYFFRERNYPLINIDYISPDIPAAWKPPDGYPVYSQVT
jgi:hypothetical protein